MLLLAPIQSPAQTAFELPDGLVLVDETVPIVLSGLDPGRIVTIRLEQHDPAGLSQSHGIFVADAEGRVDLSRSAPLAGTYSGVAPMGLIWSVEQDPTVESRPAVPEPDLTPVVSRLTAEIDAFDGDTGEVVWTTPGVFTYSSPLVVELDGVRQVVSIAEDHVVGLSAHDGVVLWTYPFASPYIHAITPIAHEGRIIVSAQNMGIRALRPYRQRSGWIVETAWRNDDVSTAMANPVVVADTLFGLSERRRGQFFALDADTGATLWLGPPRQAENTAIVKTERLLFLLNDDAELIVARPSRAGFEQIVRYAVADSATWAQPAISGNRFFVKDMGRLILWTVTSSAP